MTIEYLGDYSLTASGLDVNIAARITDGDGSIVKSNCQITLWNGNNVIFEGVGAFNGLWWTFTIPASVTIALHGRFFYAISNGNEYIDIRQPITII